MLLRKSFLAANTPKEGREYEPNIKFFMSFMEVKKKSFVQKKNTKNARR